MINKFSLIFIFILKSFFINNVYGSCYLPNTWSGKWYQGKDVELQSINRTQFLNKGTCIEQRQDKFIFYDGKEECYRCIFIMQKHSNVLQYRASYCSEQSDFYSNCQNLSPESELVTAYRDNPLSEKCPLNGLYVLAPPTSSSSNNNNNNNNDERSYRSSNGMNSKCLENHYKESMIMECSDQSMLKLQFGKCTNMPTFIVNCIAHWTEGPTNYLIGKVSTNPTQKPTYKCLVYTETSNNDQSNRFFNNNNNNNQRQSRNNQDSFYNDFIDLNSNQNSEYSIDSPPSKFNNIQISISQDEFCRNIDNMIIDDQSTTFSFNRVHGSKYHVAPPQLISQPNNKIRNKRQLNQTNYIISRASSNSNINQQRAYSTQTCKFPKWLNKKWHNLRQTKQFSLDYKLDSLLVIDEKNSIVINKYTCAHMKSRKTNQVQAIVKTLNGCSTGYQCLSITSKSEFVLEIKFGKISYESSSIDCSDNHHITQEFVYVDTNYGVKCPLLNGIYEKLNAKASMQKSSTLSDDETNIRSSNQEPCKYLTQTQTLQVGCVSEQQYSLKTKLCYPNHQYNNKHEQQSEDLIKLTTTTAYTQLESEINLVCLAYWRHDGNHVIVSRTMTNEILCSIWSTSDDGKYIQLLEIDSNCNYNSKRSQQQQRINYGFMYISSCNSDFNNINDEKSLSFSSQSSSIRSLASSTQNLFNNTFFIGLLILISLFLNLINFIS